MHADRLLRLADLLEQDAGNKNGIKFDISGWGYSEVDAYPAVDCNTQACAVGLACISGIFKEEGLGWSPAFAIKNGIIPTYTSPSGRFVTWEGVDAVTNFTWEGVDAVTNFFDINHRTASWLFYIEYYPQNLRKGAAAELAVANRIRAFVAGKERPYS